MSLINLYDGSEEMVDYLEISLEEVNQDPQRWNTVIGSHLLRINGSSDALQMPSFDQSIESVNISRPLSLEEDLTGKIVIIDFFTYCCINCEQILPYLKAVEDEFVDNASVITIGVHSPKFPNERDHDNVKNAVFRNNIAHPVLHDPENSLWKEMGIYCWPTVLILSPAHVVLFSIVGESQIDKLSHLVHQTVKFFESQKVSLNYESLSLAVQTEHVISEILLYPTNVAFCDELIVVSDTGHNRLLIISLHGEIMDIIGNVKAGFKDGSYSEALFNNPHGTAWLRPNIVFVADTGNHSVRQIDLLSKTVITVFDARTKNYDSTHSIEENESQPKFLSPWDLCIGPELGCDTKLLNTLYIAVAGSHQIWALNLDNLVLKIQYALVTCLPFAGNGKEECRNNSYKMKAGFAQPSGITYSTACPNDLFIADSESSTIRSISLINGAVKNVVGGCFNPEDLFQFGDIDGKGLGVKLQHPLSVCVADDGKIYVADTYNHKIKVVDFNTRECSTLVLRQNEIDETSIYHARDFFVEPSGLCYNKENNSLLVSDTNNHCLKLVDLKTNIVKKINTCKPPDCLDSSAVMSLEKKFSSTCIHSACIKLNPSSRRNLEIEPVQILLNDNGEIHFNFLVETEGISLTPNSPQPWNISFTGDHSWKVVCSGPLFQEDIQPSLILKCLSSNESDEFELKLNFDVTACDDVKKTCFATGVKVILQTTTSSVGCNIFHIKVIL